MDRVRQSLTRAFALTTLALGATAAAALDRIVLSVGSVTAPAIRAAQLTGTLELSNARPELTLASSSVDLGDTLGRHEKVTVRCAAPDFAGPDFGCGNARIQSRGGPLGALSFSAAIDYQGVAELFRVRGNDLKLAGGRASFVVSLTPKDWRASVAAQQLQAGPLRKLLEPYASLPTDFELSGGFDFTLDYAGDARGSRGQWQLLANRLNFGNADGTLVGENVQARLAGTLADSARGGDSLQTTEVTASDGQALLGPVLLDLKRNPLELRGRGVRNDREWVFTELRSSQRDLLEVIGNATLALEPTLSLRAAKLRIERAQFPAAYASFLQLTAAATVFGALETAGIARGDVVIADDAVTQANLTLQDLELRDKNDKFAMSRLRGEIAWRADDAPNNASWLAWESGSSYGLSGDAARIDFLTQGRRFKLTKPARIPIFDGALLISSFAAEDIGLPEMHSSFEGDIEPIGMPQLSRAFGWPELAGTFGGRIPRVEYRDKLVTFTGDVEARVFNGRVVGSQMRLQDPLGPWPRFFADVSIEDLDLQQVTGTFSVGTITGRLAGSIRKLELFNWSPVSFDAALQTPAGDRGRHRISAKAVGELSNIGGGGGGVVAKLQSGAFKLFDEYDYDKLGIRCQLANDVCLMSGIESTGIGYYIVKGKGIPRIDIVGNAGRVNWRQLVSQIATNMRGQGTLRIE